MEHSTTGLPLGPSAVDRALEIVKRRGYVPEPELLRMVKPGGEDHEQDHVWRELQDGPLAQGTLLMFWTAFGTPYYLSPLYAMRLVKAERVRWVKDGAEEVPVVNGPSDFELEGE